MKVLYLILLLTLPLTTTAQTKMSPEEILVRTTYAKLAYAIDVQNVHDLRTTYKLNAATPSTNVEVRDHVAEQQIKFVISNFTLHSVTDSGITYADIVTKPSGEYELSVTPVAIDFVEHGKKVTGEGARAAWTKGQDLTEQDWNLPASKAFAEMQDAGLYKKYGAYTVTVTFAGRSRTYNAIFLFGSANGQPKYLVVDTVTGNSALTH